MARCSHPPQAARREPGGAIAETRMSTLYLDGWLGGRLAALTQVNGRVNPGRDPVQSRTQCLPEPL